MLKTDRKYIPSFILILISALMLGVWLVLELIDDSIYLTYPCDTFFISPVFPVLIIISFIASSILFILKRSRPLFIFIIAVAVPYVFFVYQNVYVISGAVNGDINPSPVTFTPFLILHIVTITLFCIYSVSGKLKTLTVIFLSAMIGVSVFVPPFYPNFGIFIYYCITLQLLLSALPYVFFYISLLVFVISSGKDIPENNMALSISAKTDLITNKRYIPSFVLIMISALMLGTCLVLILTNDSLIYNLPNINHFLGSPVYPALIIISFIISSIFFILTKKRPLFIFIITAAIPYLFFIYQDASITIELMNSDLSPIYYLPRFIPFLILHIITFTFFCIFLFAGKAKTLTIIFLSAQIGSSIFFPPYYLGIPLFFYHKMDLQQLSGALSFVLFYISLLLFVLSLRKDNILHQGKLLSMENTPIA